MPINSDTMKNKDYKHKRYYGSNLSL